MKAGKMALERALTHGRRLEDEVLSIQNQERARLARDLHDGICQNLGAVTFMLEMHMRQLAALGPESKPAQSGQKVREMLSHTLREMRGLSHELSGVETCAKGGERPGTVIGCSRVRGRLRSSRRLTALARLAPRLLDDPYPGKERPGGGEHVLMPIFLHFLARRFRFPHAVEAVELACLAVILAGSASAKTSRRVQGEG